MPSDNLDDCAAFCKSRDPDAVGGACQFINLWTPLVNGTGSDVTCSMVSPFSYFFFCLQNTISKTFYISRSTPDPQMPPLPRISVAEVLQYPTPEATSARHSTRTAASKHGNVSPARLPHNAPPLLPPPGLLQAPPSSYTPPQDHIPGAPLRG